ncbi:MAG: 50S ribosomal protein L21 [Alphaproteobacteria bacterium]|nr:50S ribosomal protein L21 [Alphaproteobacteria bacterium]
MYAVVQAGGKQYRVSPGDIIVANRLPGEDGETVVLSEVLMVDDGKTPQIGSPLIDKAVVRATIIEQGRDNKIIVFKKRRRQGYRRKRGHRQDITVMRIVEISAGSLSAKAAPKTIAKKSELIQAAAAARSAKGAKTALSTKAAPTKSKSAKAEVKKPTAAKASVKAAPKAAAKEIVTSSSTSTKPKAASKKAEKSPKAIPKK